MEIKLGKIYKTAGGWIATVDEIHKDGFLVTHHGNGSGWRHHANGSIATSRRDFDLVSEA